MHYLVYELAYQFHTRIQYSTYKYNFFEFLKAILYTSVVAVEINDIYKITFIVIYLPQPAVPYKISQKYHSEFDRMRGKLRILISGVTKSLKEKTVPLDDLKDFLSYYPELKEKAEAAESIEAAMRVVCDHTSLINTAHLEIIAERFKLQDAISLIEKFNKSIDAFCKTIQTEHIYGQDFMENKNLHELEEVKFVLEWEGDESTLSDIQALLAKAFHDKARHVMVKVVNKGNSIIVFCYAPPHLHKELKRLVMSNKEDLRKMKVLSVTIGGFLILEREMVRFSALSLN